MYSVGTGVWRKPIHIILIEQSSRHMRITDTRKISWIIVIIWWGRICDLLLKMGGAAVDTSSHCIVVTPSSWLSLPAMFSKVEVPKAEGAGARQNSNPVIWCRNLEISSQSQMDWWLDDNLNSPISNCWNENRSCAMADVCVVITQKSKLGVQSIVGIWTEEDLKHRARKKRN